MNRREIPDVEARLLLARQNIALLARLHFALWLADTAGANVTQSQDVEHLAGAAMVRLSEEALEALTAVNEALDTDALTADAPDVEAA